MDSNDRKRSETKRLPPLVLPDKLDFYSDEFKTRLKYFTASSNGFKWNQTNINSKTKKFLARNGFNSLFWSAIIIDNKIIPLVLELFGDNLQLISDDSFETTFGVKLDKSSDVSFEQLLANYFLLFSLPAKSHTKYLEEWVRRRLSAFYRTVGWYNLSRLSEPGFDAHPELFLATKQRFYVYKDLVPRLTLYAIDGCKRVDKMKYMFDQIKFVISYSGLQAFYFSWNYSETSYFYKVFQLNAFKEDIKRITSARNVIIEKYGEQMVPFARLMNYPEAEGLDRRHYPDLAYCAFRSKLKDIRDQNQPNTWNNFTFRRIKTKTPTDELNTLTASSLPLEVAEEQRLSQMTEEEIQKEKQLMEEQLKEFFSLFGKMDKNFVI